ncbi:MAG TPA: tRNA (adenosine(37)-N6)-threonylcarbamoyltransferase complex dimerization subunit type 1 TsaB [Pyrinomonadaceae bacterium]|jgi:tRNA threonylcarbamoyladenosine biosynthesis protein TsaB|nr:tRNA (adenosine(37)-N6)-threonylcarbamoyltransferase complex dimerization subunit type 1 TsaB [Pyrinomonadaceae bacterium]
MSNSSSEEVRGARGESQREGDGARPPLTLCVDSATDAPGVAVARGARVLAKSSGGGRRGQSLVLLSEIDAALRAAGVSLDEIELFAVAAGPGSFTGLRAGLATVKAFASVRPRPVAPIPTLHAVAASAGASALTIAAIPAGRGEIFAQTLAVREDGRVSELSTPRHVSPTSLITHALASGGLVKWAGGGARAHAALIGEAAAGAGIALAAGGAHSQMRREGGGRVWELAAEVEDYAAEIIALSLISYRDGGTVGAGELRALYVRLSDAELKERCRG